MNRIQSITAAGTDRLLPSDVSALSPFADLSDAQIDELMRLATVHRVARDETFFDEGERADNFYILLDGFLRVGRTTQDGDQVIMLHISSGQMFGIAKAFDCARYTMTARAASDGVALSWPSELWDRFIQDYPGFKAAARVALGHRMKEMQDRVVSLATARVERRIAQAILRLMKQAGKATEDGIEIDFPLTRQDISDMTGTTLHSVSRCMSGWQRRGIVRSERRRVVVCEPEALPA
ncbi:MAG: Crp/Fnr family transcriptional regulator [Pseudomonadota bacterium]